MNVEELKKLDTLYLTPAQVAPLLGCDPQDLRVQAKMAPEKLGFPTYVIGTRVKIPKIPFLRFFGIE